MFKNCLFTKKNKTPTETKMENKIEKKENDNTNIEHWKTIEELEKLEISIEQYIPHYEELWIPYNPLMADNYNRFQTFATWPMQMQQKPLDLSSSGFYYLKEGDKVRCFYCGIMIHKWEEKDDIVSEHRRHSGKCKYLLMVFGKM